MDNVPTSLYRELGVKPGVSPQKLRQAYRKSVMRYHPDTAIGGGNTEKFRQVTEAYKLLQKMTVEMHRSSKTTPKKTYDLKQKFASVFLKKKKDLKENKTSHNKTSFSKSCNEKIKVNQQTSRLSLEELINCVELSENEYVRQVAMEAIAVRKEDRGVNYLLQLLKKPDYSFRSHLINALKLCGFRRVSNYLFPFILDPSIEVSSASIIALESIDIENRSDIVEFLRKNTKNSQSLILQHISMLKKHFFSITSSKNPLGKILLQSKKISEEQLEIALLIQKRFPLLLGQILRNLEYVSINDIKNSIASQKKIS